MTFIDRKTIIVVNQIVDMVFSSPKLVYEEYINVIHFSPTGEGEDYIMVYSKKEGYVYFVRDKDGEKYLDTYRNIAIKNFFECPDRLLKTKVDLISNQKFQDFIMMREMK